MSQQIMQEIRKKKEMLAHGCMDHQLFRYILSNRLNFSLKYNASIPLL